jgi:sulfite exporter TauE/SafE
MNESMLATLALGFVLGIKHATEADHLAAVSTIVSQRRSVWQSAAVGVFWGIGHTAALIAAGVLVLCVGLVIPEKVANVFELFVALMIIFLGMRLLHLHIHAHSHGGPSHIHLHFQDEEHASSAHSGLAGWRSVIIGMIHGLAGSAALTLLVLSQVARSGGVLMGFAYLLIFGAGSVAGMLVMSSLISIPFALGLQFFQRSLVALRIVTGVFSTSFGIVYALRIAEKLSMF